MCSPLPPRKSLLSLILALAVFCSAGCGGDVAASPEKQETEKEQAEKEKGPTDGDSKSDKDDKDDKKDYKDEKGEAKESPGPRKRPAPPGSEKLRDGRERMVRSTISHPRDGRRAIRSEAVIEALRAVPRWRFIPEKYRRQAHRDSPLPIGHGQTISQPYIVAWMSELLDLKPDSKVLEIGTGSGYQAAVLAHLVPHVYTVEIIEPLHKRAKSTLKELGYREVECRRADGYFGWKEKGPFDAIIVTCAAGHLPPPLWEQLKPLGRIVIPIGGPYQVQRLIVVTKTEDGKRRSRTVSDVRFVPLTRGRGQ